MNSYNTATPHRNHGIDILKAFSTFLIFFNHGLSHVWMSHPMDTFTWKFVHFFFLLSRLAVPTFFLCSGAGMLQKEHSISQIFRKNIFQLLKIYGCWMLVYGIVSCVSLYQDNLASLRTCINALVKSLIFGQYHTWFILTLLSLYLITPFLYQITRNREHMQFFLVLSITFTLILPCLNSFDFLERLTNTLNNFNMHFVYGYVLYYVAGYYLTTLPRKKIYNYIAIFFLLISFCSAYLYSMNVSITFNEPYQKIFSELSPFTFLTASSAFYLFAGIKNKTLKYLNPNLLKTLTYYGYALYLMHPLFLKYVQQLSGLFVFVGVIALYLLCLLICYLISKNRYLSKLLLK